jgi:hypothetical protein
MSETKISVQPLKTLVISIISTPFYYRLVRHENQNIIEHPHLPMHTPFQPADSGRAYIPGLKLLES